MPPLSKKNFGKSQKGSAFKPPLLTKENIEKVLGEYAKPPNSSNVPSSKNSTTSSKSKKNTIRGKMMSIELSFEENISESQHSDISYRMNEPAIKDAYIQFVKNLREPINDTVCSTPLLQDKYNESEDIFASSQISALDDEINVLSQDIAGNKASGDSGLPPSQETLQMNDEIKEKHSNSMMQMEELNFMKNFKEPAKKKARKSISISLSGDYEKLSVPEKVKGPNNSIPKQPSKKLPRQIAEPAKKQVSKKQKGSKSMPEKPTTGMDGRTKQTAENEAREIAEPAEKTGMTLFEKMLLIQESRNVGLYGLCDACDKARYLPDVKDPLDLPDKWYCHMNPDPKHNKCSDPEEAMVDEDFLIDNLYNAGSIVWAKMDGYPWWPAMVEDDPDSEDYFYLERNHGMKPTHYHVTFFDSYEVTRAWIRTKFLKPFKINKSNPEFAIPKFNKFKARVEFALEQAEDAVKLSSIDRLRKYSFIQRYTNKPLLHKVKEKSHKVAKTKKQHSESLCGKKKQRVCKRILSSDDENSNISVILNNMDWQNDNLNLNIIEKFI